MERLINLVQWDNGGKYMPRKNAFKLRFLNIILLIAVLLSFSLAITPKQSMGAALTPDHITLTWEGDPQTTQTITWRTPVTSENGLVQFMEALPDISFSRNAKTIAAEVELMTTNLGDIHIHHAALTGLKPGTRYYYRVGDNLKWSELRSFTTEPIKAAAFKFLVFGDSQSVNYDVWRDTLHQAYLTNKDAVFFTNVGDLVDVGQDYREWNSWFAAAEGVIDYIPAMPITGNHETYTPEHRFSMPTFFKTQFKLPANGPEGLQSQVYSFDYGEAHFIMLDSQQGEERQFEPDMLDKQKEWLEKDLAATKKKWKIAFIHRSPYNNKESGGNENIRSAFVPIFDKYNVNAVFTGHDHAYARSYPLYQNSVAANPSMGTIYIASGRSGTKVYRDNVPQTWNEFFHNPSSEPNYIAVEVQNNFMAIKSFGQSGVLLDEWTIQRR